MKKDHFEVLLEEMKGQFNLVLEGHDAIRQEIRELRQVLGEKIDMNTFLLRKASKKTDAIAPDFSVHRADTGVHCGYKVCEGK